MMRIRSLYTKFFLFFIGGTVLSMVLVFILLHALFFERALHKTVGFSDFFRESIVRASSRLAEKGRGAEPSRRFSLFIDDLATRFDARMWVTDNWGKVIKDTAAPPLPKVPQVGMHSISPFHIQKAYREGRPAYFRTVISGPDGAFWNLHILFNTEIFRDLSVFFAIGLALIVLMEGLLIFPMYRHTAKPLRQLRGAAELISGGDLSARSGVRGRDEIRELGAVFDTMAANLERYVRGTRELAANISHELRTPLARLRLAVELLGGEGRHRDTIEKEIAGMDDLIGRILDLSRLDLAPPRVVQEPVRLDRIVRDAAEGFRDLAERAGMAIAVVSGDGPVLTEGCADTIFRGLAALLENAIRHGAPGSAVGVALEAGPPPVLTIRNGILHPPALPPAELLGAFVKGDRSQGSGLGLAIALRAFRSGGGDLAVRVEGGLFVAEVRFA